MNVKKISTPIFLLHGLGSHPITLLPLEIYLNSKGFSRTKSIKYNPDRTDIDSTLDEVDQKLSEYVDKYSEEIILIGQSMGGVVANKMHTKGWKIKKAIYIGSPLHGARMVNIVDVLPEFIIKFLRSPAWELLRKCERSEEPPHDYHTISMGWYDTEWDSRVFIDETMLDPDKHIHLKGEDHCLVFLKPKLWEVVTELLLV